MRGWRAWYTGGRRYSSAETRWQSLPREGCLGVVVYLDPPYRKILDGHDWIYLKGGDLRTVTTHPEWGRWSPYPSHVKCKSCVKKGAPMPDDEWAVVQAEMMEARAWPSS